MESGEKPNYQTIAIAGLGLLGASLAEGIKKKFPGTKILGVSSKISIEKARQFQLIDQGFLYNDYKQYLPQADLVFLCMPIGNILEILEKWTEELPLLKKSCTITDVGSTKTDICRIGSVLSQKSEKIVFIGSHPMAGSEKTGIDARDPHLFENAAWIFCPSPKTSQKTLGPLLNLASELGARTKTMSPEVHDHVIAGLSHLPQILSTVLAEFADTQKKMGDDGLELAGGGFRDMTRIAASAYSVWKDILLTNRIPIMEVLEQYSILLKDVAKILDEQGSLENHFQRANQLRGRLQERKKGFSYSLNEILVDMEDKPGELMRLLKPLSDRNLNILDLEILKVREGEGGTMMMAFKRKTEAEEAISCLHTNGIEARMR